MPRKTSNWLTLSCSLKKNSLFKSPLMFSPHFILYKCIFFFMRLLPQMQHQVLCVVLFAQRLYAPTADSFWDVERKQLRWIFFNFLFPLVLFSFPNLNLTGITKLSLFVRIAMLFLLLLFDLRSIFSKYWHDLNLWY